MEKGPNILRKASVLLIAAFLLSVGSAVIADTNEIEATTYTNEFQTYNPTTTSDVIWDNMGDIAGMLAAQYEEGIADPLDAYPGDDFMFDGIAEVTAITWQGGYYNCDLASGPMDYNFDWNITFYEDRGDGEAPGAEIAEFVIDDADITREFNFNSSSSWYANYSAEFPSTVTFDPLTKYWVSIIGIGATFPQSGWARHVDPINLHMGVFRSAFFGFPDWVNVTDLGLDPVDFNFQLIGDITPIPEFELGVSGGLGVTVSIDNVGAADATNVEALIEAEGGLLLLGGSKTVGVGDIAAGEAGSARSLLVGFGKPIVNVTVTCDEGVTATATYEPKLLFLFLVL